VSPLAAALTAPRALLNEATFNLPFAQLFPGFLNQLLSLANNTILVFRLLGDTVNVFNKVFGRTGHGNATGGEVLHLGLVSLKFGLQLGNSGFALSYLDPLGITKLHYDSPFHKRGPAIARALPSDQQGFP
jgi:hypothetical protein